MSTVAYFLRLILSSKESKRLFPKLSQPKDESQCVKFIRQHIRLFIRILAVAASINTVLRVSRRQFTLPALQSAASITSTAAIYRCSFAILSKVFRPKWLASSLSGALCSLGLSVLVPTSPSVKISVALYAATSCLEWLVNWMDDKEMLKRHWLGAWTLFPLALGQLIYVFVHYPDSCPAGFRAIMLGLRGPYLPPKPEFAAVEAPWPTEYDLLAAVRESGIGKSSQFRSPLLLKNREPVSSSLEPVYPVLASAHPAIKTLSAALLHPDYRNEWKPFILTVRANFKKVLQLLLPLSLLTNLVGRKLEIQDFAKSLAAALRTTVFASLSTASAWASISSSQASVLSSIPPSIRLRSLGFLSGIWAFLDSAAGRTRFLYVVRLALLSQYNLATANGARPLFRHDSAVIIAIALAVSFGLFNVAPEAIGSGLARKVGQWMQSGEWRDPAPLSHKIH